MPGSQGQARSMHDDLSMKGGWGGDTWANPLGYLFFHKQDDLTSPEERQIVNMSDLEWNYYNNNVVPVQQKLLGMGMDPRLPQQNAEAAKTAVDQSFDRLPSEITRQFGAQGIRPNAMQQQALDKRIALNRGISEAGAMNNARQQTVQQQRGILLGNTGG